MRILVKDINDGSLLAVEIKDAYYSNTITYADEDGDTDDVYVGHCIAMEVNDNDIIYVIVDSLEECNQNIQALFKNGMFDFTYDAEQTFIYPERYLSSDLERLKTFEKRPTENNPEMSGTVVY